jgi:hypothetical protein
LVRPSFAPLWLRCRPSYTSCSRVAPAYRTGALGTAVAFVGLCGSVYKQLSLEQNTVCHSAKADFGAPACLRILLCALKVLELRVVQCAASSAVRCEWHRSVWYGAVRTVGILRAPGPVFGTYGGVVGQTGHTRLTRRVDRSRRAYPIGRASAFVR